jgi:hypothetical protein
VWYMKGPLSSTTRSHGCGLIASMQYPLPRAPHFLPFAAAAMDTYAPRTIEQFHACTRQRLKSAAAQQKQLQQGKGAAAAAAAGSAAAAAATQKVKAAAAATPAAPVERADGRKNTQLRSTCELATRPVNARAALRRGARAWRHSLSVTSSAL